MSNSVSSFTAKFKHICCNNCYAGLRSNENYKPVCPRTNFQTDSHTVAVYQKTEVFLLQTLFQYLSQLCFSYILRCLFCTDTNDKRYTNCTKAFCKWYTTDSSKSSKKYISYLVQNLMATSQKQFWLLY